MLCVIDIGRGSVFPQVTITVETAGLVSDNIAIVIDPQRISHLRIGIANRGVLAVRQPESLGHVGAGAEAADRASQQVGVEQPGIDSVGMVDDGQRATFQQESMNVPRVRAVLVETAIRATAIAPVQPRGCGFRRRILGEGSASRAPESH